MIDKILLRLPKRIKEELKQEAKFRGMTLNGYIISILITRKINK